MVAVVCRAAAINWGNYQNVFDTIYDLVILKWDKDNGVLSLYASDYNALRSERMAVAVTDDNTKLVSGSPIFNILNNVELPLVKSLGSARVGAISFTSYFGPNVTEGLANIEKAEAELNNIACLGYEDGERVLWGGTQRHGKIWQVKTGTVSEWMGWTAATWAKVTSEDKLGTNITRDFLRPQRMDGPHSAHPIAAQWGEQAQMRRSDRQVILFGGSEVPLIMVDVEIADVATDGEITLRLSADSISSEYKLTISKELSGGYQHQHVSGSAVLFRKARDEAIPLEEYLQKDPFIIRYADGTYSYNCYHIATKIGAGVFDRERLEARHYHDLKRRHDAWIKAGASRFLKGDMKGLSYFKEKARRAKLQFEVLLVQPGASIKTVTEDSLRLLATTELYLMKTTDAAFRVIVSP